MLKILVVEDDPNMVSVLSEVLRDERRQVVTANSPERALELVRQESPALVLADIEMPEGRPRGLELLKQIKEYNRSIPVVMIMSYRGDLGENNWWAIPHGMTMEPLLEAMRIPYKIVEREDGIRRAIHDAFTWAHTAYYHSAVVLGGSIVR